MKIKPSYNFFLLVAFTCMIGFVSSLKAEEKRIASSFQSESYVNQMLFFFKASELMNEEWINYIRERATIYQEIARHFDRFPFLANLEYVGRAKEYAYDFLAMQAVRCERYRELLSSRANSKNEPEHEFQLRAFENCVSILYTRIREALVDLKLKGTDRQQ